MYLLLYFLTTMNFPFNIIFLVTTTVLPTYTVESAYSGHHLKGTLIIVPNECIVCKILRINGTVWIMGTNRSPPDVSQLSGFDCNCKYFFISYKSYFNPF